MVNNFSQIRKLLEFKNQGDFYFCQLIVRKKDLATVKGGNNNSRLVKAYYISSLCGHRSESLESVVIKMNDYLREISKNVTLSENLRTAYKGIGAMMNVYIKIINAPGPMFWFVNDRNSDKIYFSQSKVSREIGWLEHYLHFNVMKYQFIKSLEAGEDSINCFEIWIHKFRN